MSIPLKNGFYIFGKRGNVFVYKSIPRKNNPHNFVPFSYNCYNYEEGTISLGCLSAFNPPPKISEGKYVAQKLSLLNEIEGHIDQLKQELVNYEELHMALKQFMENDDE